MKRLFPRALVACINEGRRPQRHELEAIRDKFLTEAMTSDEVAARAASLALHGDVNGFA